MATNSVTAKDPDRDRQDLQTSLEILCGDCICLEVRNERVWGLPRTNRSRQWALTRPTLSQRTRKDGASPSCCKASSFGEVVSRRTGETNRSLSDLHPNSLGNARAVLKVA